ncbi:MAG: type IV toxin-antitoxin system AbiEi family antitoxin domain-containing protein [Acidimicrobiia bacterium]
MDAARNTKKRARKEADPVLLRVRERAEEQHSMVSTSDMEKCGASHIWISRRTREGVLIRVGPSAYRFAGVRSSFENEAMAAVLSARAPALVSHMGAAHLHAFERIPAPRFVDITVPRHRRPRSRPGIRLHESKAFDLAGAVDLDGIPVTGVARTILDCAAVIDQPIRLLDDALRRRIVTWEELWDCHLAHNVRGRRGLHHYRRILLERDGNTPPGGEFARRMARVLTDAGLPAPVFEHPVVVNGHLYYLDLAWPLLLVAVECNDRGSHETPKAFRRDPMKRNRCEAAGWIYLEFTWWDLVHNTAEVVAQVTTAFQRAAAA